MKEMYFMKMTNCFTIFFVTMHAYLVFCMEQEPSTPVTSAAADVLMQFSQAPAQASLFISIPVGNIYTCALCQATTDGYKKFLVHLRSHRSNLRFKCSYAGCRYAAAKKINLDNHERIHTLEKPHKCAFAGCGFATTEKDTLTKHVRTHTKEKPYACSFQGCKYRAARRDTLFDHEKTHTREKPYICPVSRCGYASIRKSYITRHMQRRHPQEYMASLDARAAEELLQLSQHEVLAAPCAPVMQETPAEQ